MTKTHEDLILKKHVGSIHCSNNMSLLQRKIFNVLLHNAYDRLLVDDFHYIPYKRLSDLIGYNSRDLMTLKKAIRSLEATVVEWNVLKSADAVAQNDNDMEEGEIWVSSTLLASVMIDTKNKICRYEYSRTLKQMLHQPEVYARINLAVQAKFNSAYGLALYENCVRFKNVRSTGWIEIGIFRKLMGVTDDRYSIFRDFNRRVLSPAVKEVNAYSDVTLSPEVRRVGQKVIALRFSIEVTKPISPKVFDVQTNTAEIKRVPLPLDDRLDAHVKTLLTQAFKLSEAEIMRLCTEFGAKRVAEKVTILGQSYAPDKINHPIKLLKAALKQDYQISTVSDKTPVLNKPRRRENPNQFSHYQDQYTEYLFTEITHHLDSMDKLSKEKELHLFLEYSKKLNRQVVMATYEQLPLEKWLKVNKDSFVEFYLKAHPDMKTQCLSIADFVTQSEPQS